MKCTKKIRRKTIYRIKLNPTPGLAVLGGKNIFMNPVTAPPRKAYQSPDKKRKDGNDVLSIGFVELITSQKTILIAS